MKKTILALTVPALLAVSAFANASTQIYKTDSQDLSIYGRAQFYVAHKGGTTTPKFSTRLGFKGTTKINDSLDAFFNTSWEMQSKRDSTNSNDSSETVDNINSRNQQVGLDAHEYGRIQFGQDFAPYDANLAAVTDIMDFESGQAVDGTYGWEWNSNLITYENKFGPVSAYLSYQLSTEEGNDEYDNRLDTYKINGNDNSSDADLSKQKAAYSATFVFDTGTGLKVHTGATRQNFQNSAYKQGYGLAFTYTKDDLYVATSYTYDKTDTEQTDAKRQGYAIAASYRIDQVKLMSSYQFGKQDSDVSAYDMDYAKAFNLGARYYFTSNIIAKLEWTNDQTAKSENIYDAGLVYYF